MNDGYITADALRRRLATPNAPTVIDVRGDEEYAAGHIPGVRHIPLSQLVSRLAEIPHDRAVVTYCAMHRRGQSRSDWAVALLREEGFEVRALDGGLPAWAADGFAVERRRPVRCR